MPVQLNEPLTINNTAHRYIKPNFQQLNPSTRQFQEALEYGEICGDDFSSICLLLATRLGARQTCIFTKPPRVPDIPHQSHFGSFIFSMETLPNEIVVQIAKRLPATDLARFRLVCRGFSVAAKPTQFETFVFWLEESSLQRLRAATSDPDTAKLIKSLRCSPERFDPFFNTQKGYQMFTHSFLCNRYHVSSAANASNHIRFCPLSHQVIQKLSTRIMDDSRAEYRDYIKKQINMDAGWLDLAYVSSALASLRASSMKGLRSVTLSTNHKPAATARRIGRSTLFSPSTFPVRACKDSCLSSFKYREPPLANRALAVLTSAFAVCDLPVKHLEISSDLIAPQCILSPERVAFFETLDSLTIEICDIRFEYNARFVSLEDNIPQILKAAKTLKTLRLVFDTSSWDETYRVFLDRQAKLDMMFDNIAHPDCVPAVESLELVNGRCPQKALQKLVRNRHSLKKGLLLQNWTLSADGDSWETTLGQLKALKYGSFNLSVNGFLSSPIEDVDTSLHGGSRLISAYMAGNLEINPIPELAEFLTQADEMQRLEDEERIKAEEEAVAKLQEGILKRQAREQEINKRSTKRAKLAAKKRAPSPQA